MLMNTTPKFPMDKFNVEIENKREGIQIVCYAKEGRAKKLIQIRFDLSIEGVGKARQITNTTWILNQSQNPALHIVLNHNDSLFTYSFYSSQEKTHTFTSYLHAY